MKNILNKYWHLSIPVVVMISPFYMGYLKYCFKLVDLPVENSTILAIGPIVGFLVLIVYGMRQT